jgi:hypothetical protein
LVFASKETVVLTALRATVAGRVVEVVVTLVLVELAGSFLGGCGSKPFTTKEEPFLETTSPVAKRPSVPKRLAPDPDRGKVPPGKVPLGKLPLPNPPRNPPVPVGGVVVPNPKPPAPAQDPPVLGRSDTVVAAMGPVFFLELEATVTQSPTLSCEELTLTVSLNLVVAVQDTVT